AATFGQRASANAHACSYQVTDEASCAIESGSPESRSNASPRSAACISRDLCRSACAFRANVADFSRPATVHRTVYDTPLAVWFGRISQNRTRCDFTPRLHEDFAAMH